MWGLLVLVSGITRHSLGTNQELDRLALNFGLVLTKLAS
jgi:hypothetical protein